jgi:hypothetical protein
LLEAARSSRRDPDGTEAGGLERSLSVTGNFGAGSGSGALMKGGQVRSRLHAGGKEIRTVGPAVKEKPFRRAIWLLFARTYRTSGLADETIAD